MIGRVLVVEGARARRGDSLFTEVCRDVLTGLSPKVVRDGGEGLHPAVDQVIKKHLEQVRSAPPEAGVPRLPPPPPVVAAAKKAIRQ